MRAEKENKVYTISEAMQKQYQREGFDIYSDDGKLIASGNGKTVSYNKYASLKEEKEALEAELKALKETKTASTAKRK